MSSQGDQCAEADPRQIGTDRLGWDYKVRCRLQHRTPSSAGQLDRDVTGTAPGTLAKNHKSLTKKGMPRVGASGGFGDLYVKLVAQVPTNLTDEQRELFKQLAEMAKAR